MNLYRTAIIVFLSPQSSSRLTRSQDSSSPKALSIFPQVKRKQEGESFFFEFSPIFLPSHPLQKCTTSKSFVSASVGHWVNGSSVRTLAADEKEPAPSDVHTITVSRMLAFTLSLVALKMYSRTIIIIIFLLCLCEQQEQQEQPFSSSRSAWRRSCNIIT